MNAPLHPSVYRLDAPLELLFAREHTSNTYVATSDDLDPQNISDWSYVHERIVQIGIERAARERELCRWLLAAERLAVPRRAGYASLYEYAERTVGLNARQTEERLRVARALAGLPVLDGALARGQLCFSAARELTRVVTSDTERQWCDWAKGGTVRQIEKAVAARRPGDLPDDRPDQSHVKHVLRFEVRAETMAMVRDLQAAVRTDLAGEGRGGEVDDDILLFEIARRALGGPHDEGRASYQVAVTRCDACNQVSIDAGGESHAVDEAAAEMMACDSQQIGNVGPHVGAAPSSTPPGVKPARASQTVPPATRRRVIRRDGKRCRVDGCRNHRYLDVHHVDPRNEGGGHDPERLLVLCGAHHQAAHRGTLCIDGNASRGFTFRHADGTPYGEALRPVAVDVARQAFGALTHMGFKLTQARELIDAVQRAGAPDSVEHFLRAALQAT
jgi:hypothetical protein